ncbi:hypothetical protein SKAU_G00283380 [Synaphobranchus kaupii]|uniref:Uncharacterized protein n=1 Tax=Synaphobranchus kaupii TaxID=118154 RepID=A0A9Q1EXH5_SYNKA|nr:hypothetical protein SKAU_G00283380 [Synaphobranchus kaupii]
MRHSECLYSPTGGTRGPGLRDRNWPQLDPSPASTQQFRVWEAKQSKKDLKNDRQAKRPRRRASRFDSKAFKKQGQTCQKNFACILFRPVSQRRKSTHESQVFFDLPELRKFINSTVVAMFRQLGAQRKPMMRYGSSMGSVLHQL